MTMCDFKFFLLQIRILVLINVSFRLKTFSSVLQRNINKSVFLKYFFTICETGSVQSAFDEHDNLYADRLSSNCTLLDQGLLHIVLYLLSFYYF
jgi:hypothetical protein